MAQDWYLMNTRHDTVSGFESDDFNNFAQDAFAEALESALGVCVEICNHDLTQRAKRRVIMEGNMQDTKLNSLKRMMLAPVGTCKSGQYVYYKKRYWLIVGLVDDNGICEKAVLALCNYLLTWKNEDGRIIQRWASAESASQYNNGELNDKYLYIRNDQLMVIMTRDDDSLLLPHRQRFIIDARCKVYEKNFPANTAVDTSKRVITFALTRTDNVAYDYQDSGYMEFLATQDEQHDADGYYVINGKGYWLCEEPDAEGEITPAPGQNPACSIECEEPVVYNGLEPAVFTARFSDSENEVTPIWTITSDFASSLDVEYIGDSICISADDRKLIDKSFELSLGASGYDTVSITVQIKAFM